MIIEYKLSWYFLIVYVIYNDLLKVLLDYLMTSIEL